MPEGRERPDGRGRPREPRSAGPGELDRVTESLVEESRGRRGRRLEGREGWASALLAAAFLAVAIPLALLADSERSPSAATVALLVLAYAAVSRVEFEVGPGSAVPTQLVLVPMLFLLPVATVPLAVAAGYVLGNAVDHVRGRVRLERAPLLVGASWFSLGPVLVLLAAGEHEPTASRWPTYLLALAAQFAFDLATTVLREWIVLGVSPGVLVRVLAWVYLVDALLAPAGLLAAVVAVERPAAVLLVLPLVALLAVFARERRGRIDRALELSSAYRGAALLLGDVIAADDDYTGSHSRGVVGLALRVADRLPLPAHELPKVEFTALLHDVGKIRVPAEIINKPGALTPEERAVINRHTLDGEEMLQRVGGTLGEVGRLVRSCHERFDGRGYPDGLAGERIPLVARIVCACDAFNAMTTDRPYRAARPLEDALREMDRCAGAQFDPRVVAVLVDELRHPAPVGPATPARPA